MTTWSRMCPACNTAAGSDALGGAVEPAARKMGLSARPQPHLKAARMIADLTAARTAAGINVAAVVAARR